jgi:hypothetical protein
VTTRDSQAKIRALDDYLAGAMPEDEAERYEEELFLAAARDELPELTFLDTLAAIAPYFAARGGFDGGLTRAQHEQLRALPHAHTLEIVPGPPVEIPAWASDIDLVVYSIAVDLRTYSDVDVEIATPEGVIRRVFRDVQFDKNDGVIYAACDAPLAHASFREEPLIGRIKATRGGNRETVATFEVRPT